jgi:hypothetical protein
MAQPKSISLKYLSELCAGEIEKLADAIRGATDTVLWTAKMRATVRGGKPCGGNRIDSMERES